MTIASIDIGTNTVLLLIAKLDFQKLALTTLLNEQRIPRIGEGLEPGKPIKEAKQKLLIEILESYKSISRSYNSEKVLVYATNAFRISANQNELIEKIKQSTELSVNVVSGLEEARLTFLGSTYEYSNNKKFAVIDIGGGSTEIIIGKKNNISEIFSLPFGAVNLTERFFSTSPPNTIQIQACIKFIENELYKLSLRFKQYDVAIAVAGTPTTLACIQNGMTEYDEFKIEGKVLKLNEVENFSLELSRYTPLEIKEKYRAVVVGREDVLLAGTILLFQIMKYLNAEEVVVSSKGLRYGAVVEYLLKNTKDLNFE